MAIILMLLSATSYYGYLAFSDYYKMYHNAQLSNFMMQIDSSIQALQEERIETALYLGSKEKSHLRKLTPLRVTSDRAISKLQSFIREHPTYNIFDIYLTDVRASLMAVRTNIDIDEVSHDKVLVQEYHKHIFKPFLEILEEVIAIEPSTDIQKYLTIQKNYSALKENTILEHTLILFFLNNSTRFNEKDSTLWEKLLEDDRLPSLSILKNLPIHGHIQRLLSTEEFSSIASSEREMIFNQSRSGYYSVSTEGWGSQINKKLNYYHRVHNLIIREIKTIESANVEKAKMPFIILSIALFVMILILIKLIFMQRKVNEGRQIFTDTLRDIELVFNKDQQRELRRLMQQGRIDHIYKFLIQAIKDANTTKDLFLASMSHEIRTPLNGILGFTQLLKESDEKEEQIEFIAVIEKSSENLLTIVNDILDLSKIKAQKIELEHIEFDPIDSFESAVESYAAKAAAEDIDFNIYLDPTLPDLLLGDPTKMSQVIVNLISNAVKFTPKNGEVNVSIEKISEEKKYTKIKFSVSDTGIGITDSQKENIFKAFTQADVSTSRKYGGTGLGLSISGKFVELMGGILAITSKAGEGSTFFFTLDIAKSPKASARNIPNMRHFKIGILNPHIGKEYIVNKNLEAYITATGAEIIRYTDESILQLHKSKTLPDILFIDHKTRLRGDELSKFIHFETKTILLSTGDQKRNLKRYKAHIDRVLYKPVNFSKTLKILSKKEEKYESSTSVHYKDVHVLVAEDNLINQKLILNILNKIGIKVSIANNGKEALDLRMQENFDMIFMDIEMPVMGGMESTGKIINYEKHSGKEHVPIVSLTANALSGDRERYIGAGMDSYLSKPIHLDALHKVLILYCEDKIA
jgi:signal transduction histidine kinase/CheY-like chemotaxis protein